MLAEAVDLNRPLFHRPLTGARDETRTFLRVRGHPAALGALKPAENGDGLVLRLYEPTGGRGRIEVEPPPGWALAGEVNLLEDPIEDAGPEIGPFQIRSWRLRRV